MADSAYLTKSVGDALSTGLAAVAVQQPADAVDFLGNYLLNYVETKRSELAVEEQRKREKAAAEEKKLVEEEAAAALEKAQAEKAVLRAEEDKLEKDVKKAAEVTECIGDVLGFLQRNAGATSAYVAMKEPITLEEGEDPTGQLQHC